MDLSNRELWNTKIAQGIIDARNSAVLESRNCRIEESWNSGSTEKSRTDSFNRELAE